MKRVLRKTLYLVNTDAFGEASACGLDTRQIHD